MRRYLLCLFLLPSCLPDSDLPPGVIAKEVTVKVNSTNNEILLEGTDPENDPVIFQISGHPTHGTFLLGEPSDGSSQILLYTPNPNYLGADTITYTSNDGLYFSAPALISITVEAQ